MPTLSSFFAMDIIFILTCTLALFFSLLHLTKLFFTNNKKKKLNLPPSPPSLPLIGHLHHLKSPVHLSLARLSARNGPLLLLRLGTRPALVVSSAALAEECFTANDITFANRPRLPSSRLITYNYTTMGTSSYGPEWSNMRRIAMLEVLSGRRLTYFSGVRADEARDLACRLFRDSAGGHKDFTRVELRTRLFRLVMNVMMRMIAGRRCYGEAGGNDEAQRFMEMVEVIRSNADVSNVGDFLPAAIGWFAQVRLTRRLARIHELRDEMLQSLIDEHMRKRDVEGEVVVEERNNRTMIDALLSLQKENPEQYNDNFIKALVSGLLTAGTETSSSTMEWAMSLLLNNPKQLEKARHEIDEKLEDGRLIEESDLTSLPYLHSIIKETLRMQPAAPLLVPHESSGECRLGGYDVPPGMMLLVNNYAIQRDPKIWREPNSFLPERFVDAEAGDGKMSPFGMGRRRCPGEGLAMRQVGLVLGTLVQCFEWRRVGPEKVDMKEGSGLIMPKATPLEALFRPRQSMISALSQL